MNITRLELERLAWKTSEIVFPFLSVANVALSSVAVLYISLHLFGLRLNPYLLVSGFLVTFSVYSLNKITDAREDIINQPMNGEMSLNKNIILIIFLISYLLSLTIGFTISYLCVIILSIPFMVGIVYSIKISDFRLKDVFLGKNISISASWALEASLLPFIFSPNLLLFICAFSFIFLKGMINTILFDMRDIKGDMVANILTVPVKIGKKKTFFLLLALNSLLFIWLAVFLPVIEPYLFILLLCIFYGYAYIIYFYIIENPPRQIYSLLVDDEWLIWMFLFFIFSHYL